MAAFRSTSRSLLLIALCVMTFDRSSVAIAQRDRDAIAPVRVGDEVEAKWINTWYRGKVLDYNDGFANVEYEWGSTTRVKEFSLEEMRFPNGEGHWRVWSDASGKFKIEGRYISRTKTDVTIRKGDGTDISVPINQLASPLRRLLAKTPITADINKVDGVVPIRVGDELEVKYILTWYPGVVQEVTREGAIVKFKHGSFGEKEQEFEFEDMRFPNGEGHWREWSDSSGEFKIIARYVKRDATHVTIRKEDGQELRVEIALLSSKLRKLLSETRIIAPRPTDVTFDIPPNTFPNSIRASFGGSRNGAATNLPSLEEISLDVSAPRPEQTSQLSQGGVAFTLERGDSISAVVPVAGEEQWVAIGTHGKREDPTTLYWASPGKKSKAVGPNFFSNERILEFSGIQNRLITAEVSETWNYPTKLCSYRIEPGSSNATPEMRWEIPKPKYASRSRNVKVRLIGNDRLLMGHGTSVSMWNLASRKLEYAVNGVAKQDFWITPDEKYFAAFDTRNSLTIYDLKNGEPLARQSWEDFGSATACISQDGRYLVCANRSAILVWSFREAKPVVELPLGGLQVTDGTPLSLLNGGWIAAGPQFYSTGLKLVVWRYDVRGVSLKHQEMVGRELLAVAMAGSYGKPKTVLVGAATVPHRDAIELMKKVDTSKLKMLEQGSRIRVDTSGDARIVNGLRQAVQANGWIEDPSSEITLSGSAKLAEPQTLTYRVTSFGGSNPGGTSEETHTVQPWVQKVEIRYQDQYAWGTSVGGVPWSVHTSGAQSLGSELSKASNQSYSLFENLSIPDEILYPRYQRGLGQTWLTASGFVDEAK